MPPQIVREEKEIDDLLNDCIDATNEGNSKYPGMSFEEGVQYAIEWLTDKEKPHPLKEE